MTDDKIGPDEPLTWTREVPTEPGWYWVVRSNTLWDVVGLAEIEDRPFAFRRFAGPIPEPQEASTDD